MTHRECANCGAALTGPFCAACGQHAHESARSLGVLFHDAWHVVTHVDGRFWQTMYLLLLRPGRLTLEYFAERRARYLPPVRVYLVFSLLFFALASLGRYSAVGSVSPAPTTHRTESARTEGMPSTPDARDAGAGDADTNPGFVLDSKDCGKIKSAFKWLETPLREACVRQATGGGMPVRSAFVANIPKMMFVFLPMMALVMLLLYWRPQRYYVEHLVFFLHTHAAMFLILLLERAVSWAAATLHLRPVAAFATPAASVYAVWYVYRAMRVYYGQGRWFTLAKFLVVGLAYAVFLGITLAATLIISALTA